ncbi:TRANSCRIPTION FACTOR KAN4-RELATED [Salix viminalis]|nr:TRANSCRIPTION FACTOR KAN4-RELATED [Salix viminalis]
MSPPAVLAAKETGDDGGLAGKALCRDRSSTADSGSSGSDLSHENGFLNQDRITYNLGPSQPPLSLGFDMTDLSSPSLQLPRNILDHQYHQDHHHPQIYGHDFKRSARMIRGVKRSARAPRMRWTTTLHAHFIHAVQLLGGHERATPKSVLELMNVKDLTLAHVKSHLQMYRTVKSTDKGSVSGQTDQRATILEVDAAGLSGEKTGASNPSDSLNNPPPPPPLSSIQKNQRNSRSLSMAGDEKNRSSLYSLKYSDFTAHDRSKEVGQKATLNMAANLKERLDSSSLSSSDTFLNLEFTLGRPSWHLDYAESSNDQLTLLKC